MESEVLSNDQSECKSQKRKWIEPEIVVMSADCMEKTPISGFFEGEKVYRHFQSYIAAS